MIRPENDSDTSSSFNRWHAFGSSDEKACLDLILTHLSDKHALHAFFYSLSSHTESELGSTLVFTITRQLRSDATSVCHPSQKSSEALSSDPGPSIKQSCDNDVERPRDSLWWGASDIKVQAAEAVQKATSWKYKSQSYDLAINLEVVGPDVGIGQSGLENTWGAFRISGRVSHKLWNRLAARHCKIAATLSEPSWLIACREEIIRRYDVAKFNFARMFAEMFELLAVDSCDRDADQVLAELHKYPLAKPPLFPKLAQAFTAAGFTLAGDIRDFGHTRMARLESSSVWKEFMDTYRTFVRKVCVPLCGSEQVVFQCPPTIRIVLPGAPATIRVHSDSTYQGHWKGEINFWIPLTDVFGSNTLWLESAPMSDDFRPMEMTFGQLLRFNGYECRHYTMKNDTLASRVSFDFRILPLEVCQGKDIKMIGDFPAETI